MLRDAVRILCQNTVSHHTKLTVEAVIGITVDDGEDTIIISINESVGATEAESYQTEEQYENTEVDASYYDSQETTVDDSGQFSDSYNYAEHVNPSIPYQAIVKKETSVVSYNVGQYDTFQPSDTITSEQTTNQYSAPYGHRGAVTVGRGQKIVASGTRRGRGRGQGLQSVPRKVTSTRSVPTMKQDHGVEVDTTARGKRCSVDSSEMSHLTLYTTTGSKRCSINTSEVSHVMLYTCQRCGKQFHNNASFLRHKKSHLGIVYRCDGCGKVLSRNDHLLAHRRRCPAALQQAPLDV